MKPRNGKYTVAEEARKMIEAGHGLSDAEIERFCARVDAVRNRRMKTAPAGEFRALLERRYQENRK